MMSGEPFGSHLQLICKYSCKDQVKNIYILPRVAKQVHFRDLQGSTPKINFYKKGSTRVAWIF